MPNCIWCKYPTSNEPQEHILLEGLVGDQLFHSTGSSGDQVRLVLSNDEVCRVCNVKRLQRLDDYLQKQMGVFKVFLNPVGTKRAQPAKVERPGLYAVRQADGPHIHVNAETHKVAAEGGIIQPAGGHPEAVRLTNLKVVGKVAEIQFTQTICLNKKFIRALHKIAFEMLCFQEGPELVLEERFDPIREYVVWGRGCRTILMGKEATAGQWERPRVTVHGFQFESGIQEWAVEMTLGLLFFVDLSPDNGVVAGDDKELEAAGLVRLNDKVQSRTKG